MSAGAEAMEKPVRAFIAFELPAPVIELAADLQRRMKQHGMRLRWVKPQNMHLTLKFLGDVDADRITIITTALEEIGCRLTPMTLTVQGMGIFPGIRKPRVVWIGVGGATDLLRQSCAVVEDCLATLGFAREGRAFKAHLTLARINQSLDSQQLLDLIRVEGGYAAKPFQVNEMVLFQSVLRPQGPVYTPLARVALSGAV